ncbi:MAG TPA: arginine--tRNA ligase [Gammaproteobacteria bacterium]|nr:arginine--tRNA ligase [Gammaproteobacteria bacterium]
MKSLKTALLELFTHTLHQVFPELQEQSIEITVSANEKFGAYQCNSSMRFAKIVQMPARAIAEKWMDALQQSEHPYKKWIDKLEVAGPGFINIWLNPITLASFCDAMFIHPQFGIETDTTQKVIVDFSSPNIAKEMHVGHLRSTIIGDSLCRLFEFFGLNVLRLNHVGDWGTAFGMLIAYLKEEIKENIYDQDVQLSDLVQWYKASKARFDSDADFKKRAQQEVVSLQSGDPENLKLWQLICNISERAYHAVYEVLGVTIQDRGESFYNPMLQTIVGLLEQQALIEVSEGAKCVFLPGFKNREGEPLPFIIQKSDGGFNYATTDLAALYHRVHEEKGDRLIYVTDAGQATHFAMVFEVAARAHFYEPQQVRCDHVPFGVVLGPDGKKFKTRSGETERLIDLLYTAITKAKELIQQRQMTQNNFLNDEEVEHLSYVLGIGAVKYADLSCNRINDYVFSYDRMLKFEGNTAAFMLYSYVRVHGIKRKIGDVTIDLQEIPLALQEPQEKLLGQHLARFPDTLLGMAQDLMPHRLCEYLYDLAVHFNAFFRDCRVEGDSNQMPRLKLCELTARVLRCGLSILGLETVDKM